MKKSIILFIAIISAISMLAQDDVAKAKTILDKVAVKTKSYKTIYAEFKYTLENQQEDITETNAGKLWAKGNKYKIDVMGVETYFDGTTIWSYLKDAEEVNITEPDESEGESLNPTSILDNYEKDFKYYYKQEKFESNRALIIVDLIPRDLEKEYSRIRLKIDKDKDMIFSIKRFGKDGNMYTITIVNYKTDEEYSDSMFKFDKTKHPKVEINDLR